MRNQGPIPCRLLRSHTHSYFGTGRCVWQRELSAMPYNRKVAPCQHPGTAQDFKGTNGHVVCVRCGCDGCGKRLASCYAKDIDAKVFEEFVQKCRQAFRRDCGEECDKDTGAQLEKAAERAAAQARSVERQHMTSWLKTAGRSYRTMLAESLKELEGNL